MMSNFKHSDKILSNLVKIAREKLIFGTVMLKYSYKITKRRNDNVGVHFRIERRSADG